MRQTRREFLVTSAAAVCVTAAGFPSLKGEEAFAHEPAWLCGDPYLATVDDPGLGGGSWEEVSQRALRFRSTAADRDRFVLGVEI